MTVGVDSLSKIVEGALIAAQRSNPRVSLRGFSNRIGVSPSTISDLIRKKRGVSFGVADKICNKLKVDAETRAQVKKELEERKRKYLNHRSTPTYIQISNATHRVIMGWEHFAILSLLETHNVAPNAAAIARRLGMAPNDVSAAARRLVTVGLLKRSSGRLELTKMALKTSDGVPNKVLVKAHKSNLELARKALFERHPNERDLVAITMAIDPKRLKQAKKATRNYLNRMSKILEQGSRTEVYKLCVQLFPLTLS